ncbi:MAG: hypothetical protein ABIR79_13390 [Candidatus Binatia bacterium]
MRNRLLTMMMGLLTILATLPTTFADAGCGCAKPPPPANLVRPAFASPGDTITLFPPDNKAGEYETKIADKRIKRNAVWKRDLSDGQYKWQVVITVPQLSMGPTAIEVKGPGRDFKIAQEDFTMMQAPIVLRQGDGETVAQCYSAAVTADHVVLVPLDITAITDHMIFNGLGENYPLLFGAQDVMIYNIQGFLMRLLTTPNAAGIYAITDPGNPDSMELTYDRHEFNTYREQHSHTGGYGLDPSDAAWHTDGTYHVDHNRLVLAIKGTVENQGLPPAGKTPNFDFSIVTALADVDGGAPTVRTLPWSTACSATPAP